MLFTLVLPQWHGDDGWRIQQWRSGRDPQADLVAPHVTLMFGAHAEEGDYHAHVAEVALGTVPFDFTFGWAMPYPTASSRVHVMLLAEQGAASFSRLHRNLYDGPLAGLRAKDRPFVPHVTIGVMDDFAAALQLCDAWNNAEPPVRGTARSVTIGELEGPVLRTLAELPLKGRA